MEGGNNLTWPTHEYEQKVHLPVILSRAKQDEPCFASNL